MIAIDTQHINERMTHEEAADLFMSTDTGKASGVSREQFLVLLHARYPTQDDLTGFFRTAKAMLDGTLKAGPAQTPARRFFEYTIGAGSANITCNSCGMTSHHPEDVAARYCNHCKKFHKS